MDRPDLEALMRTLATTTRQAIASAVEPLQKRIDQLEAELLGMQERERAGLADRVRALESRAGAAP